ncbi:hypothetical protein ZWY2020_052644 [Hordeum vulgare]|nr:hypothetical protein ZWY2020_052644 [Hordeum vulgare]
MRSSLRTYILKEYDLKAGLLRRSKRLNVIQVTDRCDDNDGDATIVREMRDPTGESFSRQNRQGTRTEHPHLARSRKRHTSTIKAGSKVVLKTSTYPNKRNVAYGTIRSTDRRTKTCGIELGAEFALVRIDQPLLDNEELIREKDN